MLTTVEEKDTLNNVMTKSVRTLAPTKTTKEALQLMVRHNIGAVVLVDQGKLAGIVTERDILRKIAGNSSADLRKPVSRIASTPVITANPTTPVWEGFALMVKNRIRRLPITNGDKLVGIVTERDLFKWAVKVAFEPNVPEDLKKFIY